MQHIKAGKITHYFEKIRVAVMVVTDREVNVGDEICIGEEGVCLEQKVESMQVNHLPVTTAKIGDEVGLKVNGEVRPGDMVHIVIQD